MNLLGHMFNFMFKKSDSAMEMRTFNELSLPSRNMCMYTSCFCEENVWKLCEHIKNNQKDLLPYCFVVFISNKEESIPLWCQKSSEDPEKPVIWDYHVILIYKPPCDSDCLVYDLDSILSFPTPVQLYVSLAIRSDSDIKIQFHRFFRVISADEFLNTFASDRSRMKRPDGSWIKEPPPYPCITTAYSTNNIDDFISMDPDQGFGDVLTLQQFLARFL